MNRGCGGDRLMSLGTPRTSRARVVFSLCWILLEHRSEETAGGPLARERLLINGPQEERDCVSE